MATSDELFDALTEAAAKPKRVETDAGVVETHSLKDRIELAKVTQEREAQSAGTFGPKFKRLRMGGTT